MMCRLLGHTNPNLVLLISPGGTESKIGYKYEDEYYRKLHKGVKLNSGKDNTVFLIVILLAVTQI